jgi:NAD(P)-dependent dehydrogenase (short-subunit alcohol dehydrogenase family)
MIRLSERGGKMAGNQDKVAIVTAASKGIGAGIARELAARGYRLALLARSPGVQQIADESGGIAVQGSVAVASDLERLVTEANERWGRIDVVVNNTGHPPTGELLNISDDDWHHGLDLIMLNVVRMARLVTPLMMARGSGAFLNISTIGAVQPDARFPISAVLRSGLSGFAKLFADKYASTGLRMNNLLPGRIDSYPQPPERISEIPARRLGHVSELSKVAAFLVSDEASYVNGQSILVDGGLVRGV